MSGGTTSKQTWGVLAEQRCGERKMQQSLDSPGFSGVPLCYQERSLWHLNEWVDRVIGPERIPDHLRLPQLLGPYTESANGVAPPRG